ncbi:MAG: hypothetical protein U0234_13825 [Sandaracinus sp.]
MTCRSGRALGALSLALLLATPACSLSRGVLGNPGTAMDGGGHDAGTGGRDGGSTDGGGDAGATDGGPRDGGDCTSTGCDDGNPCTDDVCTATGCTHTANTASCDDGVLCNGHDTCSASACSLHDGISPCLAGTVCDPGLDTCVGCTTDAQCMPTTTDWGACVFADFCATTGSHSCTVTSYTCSRGTCMARPPTTESEACTRASTDGLQCAAPAYGEFGACDFGTDPCTTLGHQTRTVTTSACASGACVETTSSESMDCTRVTEGMTCADPTMTPWSLCSVGATCGTTGTQTRTVTTSVCASGTCATTPMVETQGCAASPTGAACGATSCGAWGTCMQTHVGTCDRSGTQTRACTTPTCSAGSAGMSSTCSASAPSTESQPCNADVRGVACMETNCSDCSVGFLQGCPHGRTGTQYCNTLNGSCMDYGLGPFCGGTNRRYFSQSCACP